MHYCLVMLHQSMVFYPMDQNMMKSFTSSTETRVTHVLCTSNKNFSWAADITDDSGYVVKIIMTPLCSSTEFL